MFNILPCKLEEEKGKQEDEASSSSCLALAEGKVDKATKNRR